MFKISIEKTKVKHKKYTIQEMLKENGVYRVTDSNFSECRFIICPEFSLYCSDVDTIEKMDHDAWKDSEFIKLDETVEITFKSN